MLVRNATCTIDKKHLLFMITIQYVCGCEKIEHACYHTTHVEVIRWKYFVETSIVSLHKYRSVDIGDSTISRTI